MRRSAEEGLPPRRDHVQGIRLLCDGQPCEAEDLLEGCRRCLRQEGGNEAGQEGLGEEVRPLVFFFVVVVVFVFVVFVVFRGREQVLVECGQGGQGVQLSSPRATIGVFGGSGFYSLLDGVEEIVVETPYGRPSGPVALGELDGRRVAFLPRHGVQHQFPAHSVPYRANVWAMKSLGVRRLFGPCAVGSLQLKVRPGDFVVCDQLVDRTSGRASTYFDGPEATHISFADPYCPVMRGVIIQTGLAAGINLHGKGTVVVVEGPRFSTRAEAAWFSGQGWEVVNMTQYPEAALARELEICYANISLITDWDTGLPAAAPGTAPEVVRPFAQNNPPLRDLLFDVIPALPEDRTGCGCGSALDGARF